MELTVTVPVVMVPAVNKDNECVVISKDSPDTPIES